MATYNLAKNTVARFNEFMNSPQYHKTSRYAKSDYWEYHASQIKVEITNSTVNVEGISGYYVPPVKNAAAGIKNKAATAIHNPGAVVTFLANKYNRARAGNQIQLLDYFRAFDAVMAQEPTADIEPGRYRIDFKALAGNNNAVKSLAEMRRVFFARDKYQLNSSMVYAYYLANIINGYVKEKPKTIMEIGAGNGNLASLLYHTFDSNIIIVDLAETLCLSIPHLASLFPNAKILMPHEIGSRGLDSADFVFLTPGQTGIIPENSVDLSVCIGAFHEMTHQQIKEYLELIQRVGRHNSLFLSNSRVEKIPSTFPPKKDRDIPVNRFAEYPWNSNNKIIVYEICKLLRLVNLDNVYLRLEQIKKHGHEK